MERGGVAWAAWPRRGRSGGAASRESRVGGERRGRQPGRLPPPGAAGHRAGRPAHQGVPVLPATAARSTEPSRRAGLGPGRTRPAQPPRTARPTTATQRTASFRSSPPRAAALLAFRAAAGRRGEAGPRRPRPSSGGPDPRSWEAPVRRRPRRGLAEPLPAAAAAANDCTTAAAGAVGWGFVGSSEQHLEVSSPRRSTTRSDLICSTRSPTDPPRRTRRPSCAAFLQVGAGLGLPRGSRLHRGGAWAAAERPRRPRGRLRGASGEVSVRSG